MSLFLNIFLLLFVTFPSKSAFYSFIRAFHHSYRSTINFVELESQKEAVFIAFLNSFGVLSGLELEYDFSSIPTLAFEKYRIRIELKSC